MKKFIYAIFIAFCLCGCTPKQEFNIVATTLPVYTFTQRLCEGTDLQVGRLITENVSCLHDYTLKVNQMQMLEHADAVVKNGAGLEDFLEDALHTKTVYEIEEIQQLHTDNLYSAQSSVTQSGGNT